jgi:predicted outer membrane repeat protein
LQKYIILITLILLLISCGQDPPTETKETVIRNVPQDYITIAEAVEASFDGDMISVAPGTYAGDGNRDINFRGKLITLSSSEGPENTIIDCQGSPEEPHRAFIFNSGEDSNAVIRGFTMINGYGHFEIGGERGGAIFCDSSSPTIVDCIFENNLGGNTGGAVSVSGSSIKIIDCQFRNNEARHGGAIYLDGTFKLNFERPAVVQIIDCVFDSNEATAADSYGGAVYAQYYNINVIVEGSIFYGNRADFGAAYASGFNSLTKMRNCTLAENNGAMSGGIHIHGNRADTLLNTIIAFNGGGQALTCDQASNLLIANCDIYQNRGGDWVGCIITRYGDNGNIWMDPEFCDLENRDLHISQVSPCAPDQNEINQLIGALSPGCSP